MWNYYVSYVWVGKHLKYHTNSMKDAINFRKNYGGTITKYREISDKELGEIEKSLKLKGD